LDLRLCGEIFGLRLCRARCIWVRLWSDLVQFLTRQGASPLDIPQAGYGSQESGARSQNRSGVAAQQSARFLQRTRQRLGVAVAKILAQNQVVTTLFY